MGRIAVVMRIKAVWAKHWEKRPIEEGSEMVL
jgi:hypothetical protein